MSNLVLSKPSKKLGSQTLKFNSPPRIVATSTVVGPTEGKGPLGDFFDDILENSLRGQKTWEKAEQKMLQDALERTITKAGLKPNQVDFLLAGDLLNQLISANFTAKTMGIPFFGLYGACSTAAESIALGSILIDGGYATHVVAGASSHYDTAERQYRFPTEFGVQRPLTAQRTVTGAGGFLLGDNSGKGPKITFATVGKVMDMGISDANDMGSAMAPAAADTIIQHFKDTGRKPIDYQLIITGDLGSVGKALTQQLVEKAGYDISPVYSDCGILIYDPSQDTHSGGSGCGCSAVVMGGYIMEQIRQGKYERVLFVGTGALLSPTSTMQGETIPGIGHAVAIENN